MNTFFDRLTGAASAPSIQTTALPRPAVRAAKRAAPSTSASPALPTKNKMEGEMIEPEAKAPAPPVPLAKHEDRARHPESAKHEFAAGEVVADEDGELTVDIYDSGDAIVIQSTVAGVKPEDLDVSITSDTVTIKGRRMREGTAGEDAYYYKELFWGTFSRSVILPEEIEDDAAEANLKNGMLTLRLPKKRHGIAQKVKVKVA